MFHQVPQFSLDDLEYAFEFSENEQVLLQRAFDNQEKGGMFHVLKQTGPSGQGGGRDSQSSMKSIAQIEYPPTRKDIIRLFRLSVSPAWTAPAPSKAS